MADYVYDSYMIDAPKGLGNWKVLVFYVFFILSLTCSLLLSSTHRTFYALSTKNYLLFVDYHNAAFLDSLLCSLVTNKLIWNLVKSSVVGFFLLNLLFCLPSLENIERKIVITSVQQKVSYSYILFLNFFILIVDIGSMMNIWIYGQIHLKAFHKICLFINLDYYNQIIWI